MSESDREPLDAPSAENGPEEAVTPERDAWFHTRIVAGRHDEARAWFEAEDCLEGRTGRRDLTVAARMLGILGDDRGSARLHLRSMRLYPDDPVAVFYGAFSVHRRFGPLRALDLMEEKLEAAGDRAREDPDFSGLWAFRGGVLTGFRDFERAHESVDLAARLSPEDTWVEVQRSQLLLREDRPEEALEVAEAALARTPNYWATIGTVGDLLWMRNRDDEALALLDRALTDNRSAAPARVLANFYDELERYEEGLAALDEFERRSPRADKDTREWLAGYRASFLYQLGRGEEMLPHAETADHLFYNRVAERVKSGEFARGKRVRLDVRFVRQNELTCAPATLTALSGYHGRAADHLEVAEEICYDGTPDYKERLWAERQGWTLREFRADWDTTRALIDAGFPFALATVEPTSAHLQAVIGYDSRAATVIIRDPGSRHYRESLEKEFFEDYAHCGPRAMVFVPPERAKDLEKIALPEAAEHDLIFRLNGALEEHDRPGAEGFLDELDRQSPGHRLVDHGRLVLSYYDADNRAGLAAVSAMLERFPDSARWEYAHYRRKLESFPRAERLDFLREKVRGEKVFTLYYKEIADLLSEDARMLPEARYYYRRSIYFRRLDAEVYHGLAGVLWEAREFERATRLYRLAACLSDRNEDYAGAFFRACRWVRRTEEGLEMLRRRYERFGSASGGPAMTLCTSLRALDRDAEVPDLLAEAVDRAPSDGELLSYAANFFGGIRQETRARELIDRAAGRLSEQQRLRLLARLADYGSRPEEALEHWRAILERSPLAMDAHRAVANLLARTRESNEAAIEHLRQAGEAFPCHVPLAETLIGWLRDEGPGRAEPALRALLDRHESNAWAWRELALELTDQQRHGEAGEAADRAAALQPSITWSHSVRGVIHERNHEPDEAAAAYRRALELDVENGAAMNGLVRVGADGAARREALAFVESQLREQVLFGEGMHTFRSVAWAVLEPEELLDSLKRANEARPDLWETWSALTDQFLAMERFDAALDTATEQTRRFPAMPRSWLDLATVHHRRGERDKEIEALEQCLTLNPQWPRALREMADALEEEGEHDRAVALLESAVRESPLEAPNHGCLADLLWKMGRRDEAFDALLRAVRVDPDYDWGWDTLGEWADLLERREEAVAEGERLVETLPLKGVSWQRLANLQGQFDLQMERLATLDRGLERLPHATDLRDQKAWALCVAGRFEAALAECREDLWPAGQRPRSLAGREAWIENERGNREVATRKMAEVAERHPDYYWAHENLVDWYQRDERPDDAIREARHLIRLRPSEPVPRGILADLLMNRNDTEGARAELEAAFGLAPTYGYAGYHLCRLDIEANRLDDAEKTLRTLEYHRATDPSTPELRGWLELKRKRHPAALEAFARLCALPDVAEGLMKRVEDRFQEYRRLPEAVAAIKEALLGGEVRSPVVARRWINSAIGRAGPARVTKELDKMPLRDEVREAAWQELIYALDRLGRRKEAVKVVKKNRGTYRASALLWASAGYVLRQAGKYRDMEQWMSDWRDREGVLPWMLINLAFGLLRLRGLGASGPVHVHAALELPEDHDTWCHHACAAYYRIWRGEAAEARAHLDRAEYGVLRDFYKAVHQLAELRVSHAESGRCDGDRLRSALEVYPGWAEDWDFRRYFFATIRAMPRDLLFKSGAGWFFARSVLKAFFATKVV